jgi:hypothetical protein
MNISLKNFEKMGQVHIRTPSRSEKLTIIMNGTEEALIILKEGKKAT